MHDSNGRRRVVRVSMRRVRVWVLATLLVAGCVPAAQGQARNRPPATGETISIDNLYDCILPLSDEYKPGVEWAITFRVVPPSETEREFNVTLVRAFDRGAVEAALRQPRSRIVKQFRVLEDRSDTPVTCEAVRAHVTLRTCRVMDTQLPVLRGLARDLEVQKWRAVPENGIMIHPNLYEARIQTVMDETRLYVQGPSGGRSYKAAHPFVRWAERVYTALADACKDTLR